MGSEDKIFKQFNDTMKYFNDNLETCLKKAESSGNFTSVTVETKGFTSKESKPLTFITKIQAPSEWGILKHLFLIPIKVLWRKIKTGSIFKSCTKK